MYVCVYIYMYIYIYIYPLPGEEGTQVKLIFAKSASFQAQNSQEYSLKNEK